MRNLLSGLIYLFTQGSASGAILSFLFSLISAIAQISAFVAIAIFVRLLEKDELFNIFGINIPSDEKTILQFAFLIPALLVLSLVLKLSTLVWITHQGKKFFNKLAEITFIKAQERQLNEGVLSESSVSSMIKYDVRYASIGYMHVLRIFYPIFVIVGILSFAFFFEPLFTRIIVFSVLIAIPFHFLLIKWGNETANRLRGGAIRRAKDVETIISSMFAHPNKNSTLKAKSKRLSKSLGNLNFLKAYVDRQRLSGYSSAISDTSMLIAVIAISWTVISNESVSEITISNLIIGFIVFKFLMNNTSAFIQTITSIGALHPFFSNLQSFIAPNSPGSRDQAIQMTNTVIHTDPYSLHVITFEKFSPWTAIAIGKAIDPKKKMHVLTANFNLYNHESWVSQLNIDLDEFKEKLKPYSGQENVVFSQIQNFLHEAMRDPHSAPKAWKQLPTPTKLIMMALNISDMAEVILLNATDCLSLSDEQWLALDGLIGAKSKVFIYNSSPRRLRFGQDGLIGILEEHNLTFFKDKSLNEIASEILVIQARRKDKKLAPEGVEFN